MASPKQTAVVAAEASPAAKDDRLTLRGGRQIRVTAHDDSELVEITAPGGEVELRVVITENGPVLRLDSVKLAIHAVESVDVQCKKFSVEAAESIELSSEGELAVESEKELRVTSTDDVRIRGKLVYLN